MLLLLICWDCAICCQLGVSRQCSFVHGIMAVRPTHSAICVVACRSNPAPSSRRRHPARDRGLDEAKRELDGEVNELNRLVGQLRSSKDWLDSREKKIKDLETLLQSGGSCSESRQGDGASTTLSSHAPSSCESGSVTERLRALEAMQQASFLMKTVSCIAMLTVLYAIGGSRVTRIDLSNAVPCCRNWTTYLTLRQIVFQTTADPISECGAYGMELASPGVLVGMGKSNAVRTN